MSRSIVIRDAELIRAFDQGADYLIAGDRRFLLVEIEADSDEPYVVTDPEEIAAIERALADDRPSLSTEEALAYLKERREARVKR